LGKIINALSHAQGWFKEGEMQYPLLEYSPHVLYHEMGILANLGTQSKIWERYINP